ncbi:MAG: coproporphyrinogen dehydrogenase HemZ [Clostridiales bacterium]|nr:coproporphyrinogen dehydrogenase HemZ [Clostridiales bacterium]
MTVFIHLPNGKFEHEIWELTRIFFPGREVRVLAPTAGEIDVWKFSSADCLLTARYSYINDSEIEVRTKLEAGSDRLLKANVHRFCMEQDIKSSPLREKRELKKFVCQCIYDMLAEHTGRSPHWGILTGVRPLKVVHNLMDDCFDYREVLDILDSEYRVKEDKAELLIETARNQRHIIMGNRADIVSLYIHIPFCPTRCLYCSFPSAVVDTKSNVVDKYLDCLSLELEQVVGFLTQRGAEIQTLYIGGGTPTVLNFSQLERLMGAVELVLNGRKVREYTVECGRPDSLDLDKLSILKAFGVNRISINPQTMNQETLEEIGRRHTVQQVVSAFNMARYIGFDCINADVIVGLPKENTRHMERTMASLADLDPDNITVHTLAVKRASRLKKTLEKYPLTNDDIAEVMLQVCHRWIKKMDMVPYYLYRQKYMVGNLENVGYAKRGKECIYNVQMMGEKQTIWGVGAGAVSKVYYPAEDRIERVPNLKDVNEYINRIEETIHRKKVIIDRI